MDDINTKSTSHFPTELSKKLGKTCNTLQKLEQRMALIAHKSQQIASEMKRIREQLPPIRTKTHQ
ncbi:hypothetical protein [Endozoicomonas ascidiicola]|uniref:hypothetical protein n=1 Tax=Endozoicomonas ascidiicola TaxID=1698521 RepID=UPI0008351B10|nr:hypothetical protein [Endozoicomonas ascidiicola]